MGQLVCNGASLSCSFGTAPGTLMVLPTAQTNSSSQPSATIMDHVPMLNIMPFAMCTSMSNPTVAAATAAALGVLTPMPCIPATSAPWSPGSSTVTIAGNPALNDSSQCMCNWGGTITVSSPGQTTTEVP
ncbi:MAG: DUF4280 domain-containing protein [Ilumatobacter sp.]|uniref:DUF4280 domain-containing protein n=1 Tax=Ilumatobacter sp. TaxID=1967498 RepID=UPI0026187C66|nr:DUF4280 domain-containing protein [Ilumatobacter sp.]MDJ0768470.1 DUF4280 domain-containing protein [Ilumatobacter sp.]